jgi:cell division protein FtsB
MTIHRSQSSGEARHAWLGSLFCWLCLLMAAAIYAGLTLSPKALSLLLIQNEFESNERRLLRLRKEVDAMDNIAEALEKDPEFNAAMARADFEKERPGEQRIRVEPHLKLEARPAAAKLTLPDNPLPWYTPVLRLITEDRRISNGLAAAAALLAILCFIIAPADGSAANPGDNKSPLVSLFSQLRERYRLPGSAMGSSFDGRPRRKTNSTSGH